MHLKNEATWRLIFQAHDGHVLALDVESPIVVDEDRRDAPDLVDSPVEAEQCPLFGLEVFNPHHSDVLGTQEDDLSPVEHVASIPGAWVHVALGHVVELVHIAIGVQDGARK